MNTRPLKKLTDKQKNTLESLHSYFMIALENKDMISVTAWKNQIYGYLTALWHIEQITANDRELLNAYYIKNR